MAVVNHQQDFAAAVVARIPESSLHAGAAAEECGAGSGQRTDIQGNIDYLVYYNLIAARIEMEPSVVIEIEGNCSGKPTICIVEPEGTRGHQGEDLADSKLNSIRPHLDIGVDHTLDERGSMVKEIEDLGSREHTGFL